MTVRRVAPDFATRAMDESQAFYRDVFGLLPAMDMGWVAAFTDPTQPACRVQSPRENSAARAPPTRRARRH